MKSVETRLEELVEEAKGGNRDALQEVIHAVQDQIYNLAVRMLWHPEDAEDATQEILVKIVTRLGSFRGESAFTTWCHRIACNHLLTTRKRRAERAELSLERFGEDVASGLDYGESVSPVQPERDLLAKEVMIACIQGVLLCLDREQRVAFILGVVYELDGNRGGYVLGITPEAYRKRVSRAKTILRGFLVRTCGLVNEANPCRCERQIPYSVKTRLVNPQRLLFATHSTGPENDGLVLECLRDMDEVQRLTTLFRQPGYRAPNTFLERLKGLMAAEGLG
jgi:RNA polymerase sigma factor (sigma-70 family)